MSVAKSGIYIVSGRLHWFLEKHALGLVPRDHTQNLRRVAMPEYKAIRDKNRCPSHPGAVMEDILQDIRESKTEIAKLLGISR
jgi:hypothetical protein